VRNLAAGGIVVPVPSGWEARASVPSGGARRQPDGSVEYPCVHLANFALPPSRAPFGSTVVGDMADDDAFVALLEFSPSSARTALFARPAPRRLRSFDLSSAQLQRTIAGQFGAQRFFTVANRALCWYVVLGGTAALRTALGDVNGVLAGLRVHAVAGAA
jgi:hypothetical protein